MKYFLPILLFITGCTGGTFHVHEENDYFSSFVKNSDKYYTQGAKFTYSFPADREGTVNSLSLGNNIYTPESKHTALLVPNERAYAGYSYAEGARVSYPAPHRERKYALQLGLVGPGSGGKFFQCGVHRLLDQKCPEGWANQIKDEPTIMVLAEEHFKIPITEYFDTVLNYGGRLGNVYTAADSGGIVRLGILGSDFGPVEITPRAQVPGYSGSPESLHSAYFFAGTEGRVVGRNIFLDGNTFEDSHRVTKNPLVADLKAGFLIQYLKYKLSYSYTRITDEWKESKSSQDFGSIDISWGW